VVPASEYRLTNNSTKFSIGATGPGLIVLGETDYAGDFVASLTFSLYPSFNAFPTIISPFPS